MTGLFPAPGFRVITTEIGKKSHKVRCLELTVCGFMHDENEDGCGGMRLAIWNPDTNSTWLLPEDHCEPENKVTYGKTYWVYNPLPYGLTYVNSYDEFAASVIRGEEDEASLLKAEKEKKDLENASVARVLFAEGKTVQEVAKQLSMDEAYLTNWQSRGCPMVVKKEQQNG